MMFLIPILFLGLPGIVGAQQTPAILSVHLQCFDEDLTLNLDASAIEGSFDFELEGNEPYDLKYGSNTLSAPIVNFEIRIDYRRDKNGVAKICHAFESADEPSLNDEQCFDAAPIFTDQPLSWTHEAFSADASVRSRCTLTRID